MAKKTGRERERRGKIHRQGERPPMEPENSKDGGQSLSHKTNEHKKLVHNNTFGLNCTVHQDTHENTHRREAIHVYMWEELRSCRKPPGTQENTLKKEAVDLVGELD